MERLYDITLTAEAKYTINFNEKQRKFCLSLHYNGRESFFVYQWSKNLSVEKVGLNRYEHDFRVNYQKINVGDILDIHKCLM